MVEYFKKILQFEASKSKKYSKKSPPAVDAIQVNFFEGQVTALLGHNGAGKTSTM